MNFKPQFDSRIHVQIQNGVIVRVLSDIEVETNRFDIDRAIQIGQRQIIDLLHDFLFFQIVIFDHEFSRKRC